MDAEFNSPQNVVLRIFVFSIPVLKTSKNRVLGRIRPTFGSQFGLGPVLVFGSSPLGFKLITIFKYVMRKEFRLSDDLQSGLASSGVQSEDGTKRDNETTSDGKTHDANRLEIVDIVGVAGLEFPNIRPNLVPSRGQLGSHVHVMRWRKVKFRTCRTIGLKFCQCT